LTFYCIGRIGAAGVPPPLLLLNRKKVKLTKRHYTTSASPPNVTIRLPLRGKQLIASNRYR
jgi:hypothetical protein